MKVKVTQLRPTLCYPWTIQSTEFSRHSKWIAKATNDIRSLGSLIPLDLTQLLTK